MGSKRPGTYGGDGEEVGVRVAFRGQLADVARIAAG